MSARMAIYVGRGHSLPADIALSLIPSLPRAQLEQLVQRLVDRLDDMDAPDEDREDDDPAGMMDEDELTTGPGVMTMHGAAFDGPGCPIADPGGYAPGDGPNLPPPSYDSEDQGTIILPAPEAIEPTRWRIS